ncbi:hypothetical protein [Streptomyces cavernicola]|uniref:TadE family protein n=1 Tax=Streptomyces cavernicola TaxID=3043613 RepID=A0ABT6SJK3_9ACTN|nr:hypothetical protein [Streptomyces sp. B-S-A6]MDI3408355.1 hypothetical protein [Streptomyces sp. B-S-A6]
MSQSTPRHTPQRGRRRGPWHTRLQDDSGYYTLEALICIPVVLAALALFAAYGLAGIGDTTTANAAAAAARAASRADAPEGAEVAGQNAAISSLRQAGNTCADSSITIDTSNFPTDVGQAGQVTATVTCTVPLSQLTVPGMPGSKTLEATRVSSVDQYASRDDEEDTP